MGRWPDIFLCVASLIKNSNNASEGVQMGGSWDLMASSSGMLNGVKLDHLKKGYMIKLRDNRQT